MKRKLRLVHKYLSLSVLALWILQAATGVLLVFHWELDDLGVAGARQALDPVKFGAFLEGWQASHPKQPATSVYASAGLPGRFDVMLAEPDGATDVLRVDGEGTVLRQRPWNYDYLHIGWLQIATYLHQTLFMHTAGNWLIGLSGLLLASNVILGLTLAWPRAGQWLRAMLPSGKGPAAAQIYSWHRALGLWLAFPALLLMCAGIIRAYDDPLADHFEDTRPAPAVAAAAAEPVSGSASVAGALRTALQLYPGGRFASLDLPAADAPWYTVHVRQAHDLRRVFGTTVVYVSARSGRVLANFDSTKLPLKTRVWDAVYPLHTGEIAGLLGRCLVTLVGLWLLTMISLGVSMWLLRRRAAGPARRTGSTAPLRADAGLR
jgi:uncharacterized iron-regulated membrane protein